MRRRSDSLAIYSRTSSSLQLKIFVKLFVNPHSTFLTFHFLTISVATISMNTCPLYSLVWNLMVANSSWSTRIRLFSTPFSLFSLFTEIISPLLTTLNNIVCIIFEILNCLFLAKALMFNLSHSAFLPLSSVGS